MKNVTAALQEFLVRHNIPGEGTIMLGLVTHDRHTTDCLLAAIRKDLDQIDCVDGARRYRRVDLQHEVVVNGIPISVVLTIRGADPFRLEMSKA